MSADIHRCTALVTGASSGIGRAVALRLAAEGHRVLGLGRSFEEGGLPSSIVPMRIDLGDLDSLPSALEELARNHDQVEVVVSNAGQGRFGSLEEFSPHQIRALIDLNFTSHVLLARAFLPLLKRRGRGRLVFVGSEAGLRGSRYGAVYSATKFALRGLAQSLRSEAAAAGVAVTVLHPGMVRTPFFDRLAFAPGDDSTNALEPEEVAEAVWLAVSGRHGAVVDEIELSPLHRVVKKKSPSS